MLLGAHGPPRAQTSWITGTRTGYISGYTRFVCSPVQSHRLASLQVVRREKEIVSRATPLHGILIDGVQRDSYTRHQSSANPYVGPRTLAAYLARHRRWSRHGTLIFPPYFNLAANFVNRDGHNGPCSSMILRRAIDDVEQRICPAYIEK